MYALRAIYYAWKPSPDPACPYSLFTSISWKTSRSAYRRRASVGGGIVEIMSFMQRSGDGRSMGHGVQYRVGWVAATGTGTGMTACHAVSHSHAEAQAALVESPRNRRLRHGQRRQAAAHEAVLFPSTRSVRMAPYAGERAHASADTSHLFPLRSISSISPPLRYLESPRSGC